MELKIINMENCYGIGNMKEILNFYMLKMGFLKLHLQKV